MPTPNEWRPTQMGPTTFYREQQSMAAARFRVLGSGLLRTFRQVYGLAEHDRVKPEASMIAAGQMRRHFKNDELLLFKADLMRAARDALTDQDPSFVAALPPLPQSTTFGFEYPADHVVPPPTSHDARACARKYNKCKHQRTFLMSVVVPCGVEEIFPGAGVGGPAFMGFARLADIDAVFQLKVPSDKGSRTAVAQLVKEREAGALWHSVVFHPMRDRLGEGVPMEHLLKMALHLGSQPDDPEPRGETEPREPSQGPAVPPAVRTVYLRRTSGKGGQGAATGTGTPLRYRSRTGEHERTYRDEHGNPIKTITIKGFTRGGHLPERPPEEERPKVKVARKPRNPKAT